MWNQKPGFRFEIDNFSEKKDAIVSYPFVSGGCEWFLYVYPKGEYSKKLKREYLCDDHLSLFIHANSSLLQPGWKRSVNFYFSVLNQSNKELYRTPFALTELSGKRTSWGFRKTFPFSKIQEKGFLEEDRLIIEVYINVSEAFDGESGDVSEKKEAYINGFRVFASQVTSVRKIFAEHPDIATYVKPKNQVVRTEYMNVLLELEERLNKLEKMESNLKLDSLKRKLDEVDSERKKAKANESRVQKLEERVKNIELMESGFMMDSLKSKLDDVSLEKKKSYYADGSRVQELEESVKDLKKMVSDLKNKLDKEEAKSSDDEFLLVNEVA
ncbi:MATH domain and coiled-coil domain-containing protein [Cardamine amara subsp. amara]|uniref:MATH domain and coiled-coil domain-containing protein n=1 Tax=Cardamine amara subsp. amara TaxID=228776 RepID=A0ABD0ZV26_CARAN